MAKKKSRIRCKIDDLPEAMKDKVEEMLLDTSYTYLEISDYLKQYGFDISKSSVGRYALRTNNATARLAEAQEQTKALVQMIKKNPEVDYTEASMMLLMDGLTKKMATAQEEFDNMPLDKAGRLIASLSCTKIYKDKVKLEMKKKIDLAFDKLEPEILNAIRDDKELAPKMKEILQTAKQRMISDDN